MGFSCGVEFALVEPGVPEPGGRIPPVAGSSSLARASWLGVFSPHAPVSAHRPAEAIA